jgi:hypothetical protein
MARRCERNLQVPPGALDRSGPTDLLALTVLGEWASWLMRQPDHREKLLDCIGHRNRLSDEPSSSESFAVKHKQEESRLRDALQRKLRQRATEGELVSWSLIYETIQALRDAREWFGIVVQAARGRDEELRALQKQQQQIQAEMSRVGQKKSSPSPTTAADECKVKLKRAAEKFDTALKSRRRSRS